MHSRLKGALTYLHSSPITEGTLVRVPIGRREVLGIVAPHQYQYSSDLPIVSTEVCTEVESKSSSTEPSSFELKNISYVIEGIEPLGTNWLDFIQFAAQYYQRTIGEIALQALPPKLRDLDAEQITRRLKKNNSPSATNQLNVVASKAAAHVFSEIELPELSQEQTNALDEINRFPGPFLLYGSTGSGKTEVYLRCVQKVLTETPTAQVLIMVPEINLTPQLEERFKNRFAYLINSDQNSEDKSTSGIVSIHSNMSASQRLNAWLAAHTGQARIVLGTRMSIFSSIPKLKLIVVDEEHDPSYKQQEGARYSARDLAVYRGVQTGAKVILGSATPSLESWHHAKPSNKVGAPPRYHLINMPSRIGQAQMPKVKLVNLSLLQKGIVISPELAQAMVQRIERGEQVLVLLNRRGFAPVLHCQACGWRSACSHCTAFRVFHKVDRTLKCHHCGMVEPVPKHCPECGNTDIKPVGKGTEQLEELLGDLLSDIKQPNGEALKILRIDADTTKLKGSLNQQLARVHSGEVNVVIGTQMIAKGHDFRKITLVAALYPDASLFSSDFRAPERLFSLLLQAAGRAGRDSQLGCAQHAEMWIQTDYPKHPLFKALAQYDYPKFANDQLLARAQAGLPPYSFQALIRADAKSQECAQLFLNQARQSAEKVLQVISENLINSQANSKPQWLKQEPILYPAIPMTIQRIAGIERSQMLIECASRIMLQSFLKVLNEQLQDLQTQHSGLLRWAIDVDPLAI